MQFTATIIALGAALSSTAMAASTNIQNKCSFPVYVSSSPNGGGATTGPFTINSGATRSMGFVSPNGAAVKLATTSQIANPLTLEYTPSGATTYYDLSNNAGNPFSNRRVQLNPSDASCYHFNCAAGQSSCYSNGASPKVKTCSSSASLTVVLCA